MSLRYVTVGIVGGGAVIDMVGIGCITIRCVMVTQTIAVSVLFDGGKPGYGVGVIIASFGSRVRT